ncbi:hypothetical protein KHO61_gp030 [Mycobacterium phage Mangeria]|uniref:Uncharacterized protein n=1 Tax=Mycobacterium phage Mangeria TaxID=2686471 RepID=A0A6B9LMP4_9CAUD|nr:hypothetical protein KHO61_gp030 [Mycobacterium phage Mangeria]QHB47599.1 hypothetical protein SEA_MANGERIA_30 [Mycobacterium phage Mangeria]
MQRHDPEQDEQQSSDATAFTIPRWETFSVGEEDSN